jgi:hypothetical protein
LKVSGLRREENQYAPMKSKTLRAIVEMGFIVFLFYSNLLMGEYERSNNLQKHGFIWSIEDIFTLKNFAIALISSFIGYAVFGFFRKNNR